VFLCKGGVFMSFYYSLSHVDFQNTTSKQDLINLLNQHDSNSFKYSLSTAQLNVAIGIELGLPKEMLYLLFQCGIFHDIGKIGMSEEFINYPHSYTMEMYLEMKKHTAGGGTLLEKINAEKELIETAKYHHCNFDGTGYPGGYYYDEIPLHARITRISDSIDAYMSKRCYKEGGPSYAVIDDLNQYKGSSYDPDLLEIFSHIHKRIMKESHKLGMDRPSQNIYMSLLNEHYGTAEMERFIDTHLDPSYKKNLF